MNYNEALKYVMDLCSKQERCRSEIKEKLAAAGLSKAETGKILDTLARENFINESRYAGTFTRDKLRFNKWGKVKIRYMLEHKKIPEAIVSEALDGIDEEWYRGILREELLKKRRTTKGSNAFDLRGKLFRFDQQRGFETGLIYAVLDEIMEN
jgi:regulatory protein